jgi:hypothetical protein
MTITSFIAPDSLIGMALADSEAAHWEASFDEDGYQDTLEADHQMDQHGHLERLVAEHADVMAVYAEEATRWS